VRYLFVMRGHGRRRPLTSLSGSVAPSRVDSPVVLGGCHQRDVGVMRSSCCSEPAEQFYCDEVSLPTTRRRSRQARTLNLKRPQTRSCEALG